MMPSGWVGGNIAGHDPQVADELRRIEINPRCEQDAVANEEKPIGHERSAELSSQQHSRFAPIEVADVDALAFRPKRSRPVRGEEQKSPFVG